jgi:hypothetical protein
MKTRLAVLEETSNNVIGILEFVSVLLTQPQTVPLCAN